MSSSIKLKTIAALAKVSISSVSRVLSNKGYVGPEARERVLNALAELTTYETTSTTNHPRLGLRVGFFCQRDSYIERDPLTSVDVTTFVKAIESRGHHVKLYDLGDPADQAAVREALEKEKLDVAIVNDDDTNDTVGTFLDANGIPWVATDGHSTNRRGHFVDNDNQNGSRALIEHLLDLGHSQVGFITGASGRWISENRLAPCRQAFALRGLPWSEDWIEPGFFKLNGGFQACNTLLDRCPDLTAIFAFNDLSAIGAIRALRNRNIRIPQDFSVVGFDDMEIATFSDPPLTTVSRFHPDLSHFLVEAVEDIVAYPGLASLQILTETRLVVRQSTMKRCDKM